MKFVRNALGTATLALSTAAFVAPYPSFSEEPAVPAVSDAETQAGQSPEGETPSMQQSEAAYAAGDYAKALEILKPLAEAGDRLAQYPRRQTVAPGGGGGEGPETAPGSGKKGAEPGGPPGPPLRQGHHARRPQVRPYARQGNTPRCG